MQSSMIKNKKGIQWVGEEVGKIIIALLVIVMLIGLAYTLFNLFVRNNTILQAEKSLDKIQTAGLTLQSGKMREDVFYESPRGWTMRFYELPREKVIGCGNGKCLCLCEDNNCDIKNRYVCKGFGKNVNLRSKGGEDFITFSKTPSGLIIKNTNGVLEVDKK